ncbi:winged helix-turn-helix transcriptional regulator [Nodosilinea nodulosa]|uniref:winged helix-turn-helix transcriptional regulator n=1 Tax=Nodosilinea nodulosa TaxID=416001 RepID=UPI0002D90DD4
MASAPDARYGCPIEVTIAVLGGKWKCVILWWLRRDAKTFGELRQVVLGITSKVLTQQLRELVEAGLVDRQSYREKPRRVEYSLTPYGATLIPITDLMCEWGKNHLHSAQFSWLNVTASRLLLVSRDVDLANALQTALAPYRSQVFVAAAPEALAQFQQQQPEILVIDVTDSTEEGFGLMQHIRGLEQPGDRSIPAIALIHQHSLEQRQALRAGFQIRMGKPIDLTEFIATLASLTYGL